MILALNAGSQSIKYGLYKAPDLTCVDEGEMKDIFNGGTYQNHGEALAVLSNKIVGTDVEIIAHRVVHGGVELRDPTIIDAGVLKLIKKYSTLAPLHNPVELETIKAAKKLFKKPQHVAVFDSGFYKDMPDFAKYYGIPVELTKKLKIERLGFHGLSHEYVAKNACDQLKIKFSNSKIISCHLGGGSSITAINNGKAVDTSMGFTPDEGLLMMTRTGDIDLGAVFYLARSLRLNTKKLETLLLRKSGVAGMTGYKQNMKYILDQYKKSDPKVMLAVDAFFYRIKKYIGGYFGILGDVDIMIFTGSIGARQEALIREKVLKGLPFADDARIVFMETDEQIMLAQKALQFKI